MAYPILAPNSTWYKGSAARSTITQINIVDSYTVTGNENESWNADVDNAGSIKCYRTGTVLTIAGNGSGKIAANADSSYLFSDSNNSDYFSIVTTITGVSLLDTTNSTTFVGLFLSCEKLTSIDVSNWNTANVLDMTNTFRSVSSITSLEVGNWNVSNVTTMQGMFLYCGKLEMLNLTSWQTGNVTNMGWMFSFCSVLTSIGDTGNWDVSKVTSTTAMFQSCTKLSAFSCKNWNTDNLENPSYMFYGCSTLTNIEGIDRLNVSKSTNFSHMFADCSGLRSLDINNWDVSSVTNFAAIFNDCSALTSIDLSKWNIGAAQDFGQMFERCTSLVQIIGLDKWVFSAALTAASFYQMFLSCTSLVELDLSAFNTSAVSGKYMQDMFSGLTSLQKITLGSNFNFAGNGSASPAAVLPTPSTDYIPGADGKWYTRHRVGYAPADVPNNTAMTYYASLEIVDNIKYVVKNGDVLDIADSIRAVAGTTEKLTFPDEFSEVIQNIKKTVEEKDVNFYDYDGTLLYSYTLAEAQALTELPPLPTRPGLICQGWNWTLAGINALSYPMTVGAMYITDDGSTRLYVSLPEGEPTALPLYFSQSVSGGVTIDWGDGNTQTISGTGFVSATHTFGGGGDFVVRLIPDAGCQIVLGNGATTGGLFGTANSASMYHVMNNLVALEIGERTTIGVGAIRRCGSMKTISIPQGLEIPDRSMLACASLSAVVYPFGATTLAPYANAECPSLRLISLPPTISQTGGEGGTFQNNPALNRIDLPPTVLDFPYGWFAGNHTLYVVNSAPLKLENITSFANCYLLRSVDASASTLLGTDSFYACRNLREFTVGKQVSFISANVFFGCYGLRCIRFLPTTPPTVANANAFSGIPATCRVEVPADSLTTYQEATNYGSIAAQMVGV